MNTISKTIKCLLCLFYSTTLFAVDFEGEGFQINSSQDVCPGVEELSKEWESGKDHECSFKTPTSPVYSTLVDEEMKSITNGVFSETDFLDHDYIGVTYGRIYSKVVHPSKVAFVNSMYFLSLSLTPNVQWSTNGLIWHDCSKCYNPINTGLEETINRYETEFFHSPNNLFIKTKTLWNSILSDGSSVKLLENEGEVTVRFRYVFYADLSYRETNHTTVQHFTGYFHVKTENCPSIKIRKCDVGKLTVDEKKNPAIHTEDFDGYAILEGQSSPVSISSKVVRNIEASVVDVIGNGKRAQVTVVEKKASDSLVNDIDISKFYQRGVYGNNLYPGNVVKAIREVDSRINASQNMRCSSDSILFKVLPKPILPGIGEKASKQFICPIDVSDFERGKAASSYLSDDQNAYYHLAGAPCKLDEYESYRSVYGMRYRWKYWTSNYTTPQFLPEKEQSTLVYQLSDLFDFNGSSEEYDLDIPVFALKEGVTYFFEPCVVLTAFGGVEISPSDSTTSYYEVRLRDKWDKDRLTVDVTPKEVCAGSDLNEVPFIAKYQTSSKEGAQRHKLDHFVFDWKIGQEVGNSVDSVRLLRNFSNIQDDIHFQVSLTDGCGSSIAKEEVIRVTKLPVLTTNNITTTNTNVSLSMIEDDAEGNYILMTGTKGRQFNITISDSEKSSHDYFVSKVDEEDNMSKIPVSGYKDIIKDTTFYVYKKSKDGLGCVSNPVKVQIIALDELEGNQFTLDEIFVCSGSKLPLLDENNGIASVKMKGVDDDNISYLWQYSFDETNWYDMVNTDGNGGKTTFVTEGYNGTWANEIRKTTYIRRVVTPKTADGTILGVYPSNTLKVSLYSSPKLDLTIDGALAVDGTKCYGDSIILSMSLNNGKLLEEQKTMMAFNKTGCISSWGYYDDQGEAGDSSIKVFSKEATSWKMPVTKNYIIRSAVDYCGEKVYSNEMSVFVHPQITITPMLGSCKIVGNEITITAVKDGHTCEIRRDGKSFAPEDGKSVAKILLEDKKEYKYEVAVKNNKTGCQVVLNKSISQNLIEVRKTPIGIGPSGKMSDTLVCAGNEISIGSTNDPGYGEKSYSWVVNGNIATGATGKDYSVTLPEPGKRYEIKRIGEYYDGLDLCYTVEDVAYISTRPQLEVPSISLSSEKICNGDSIVVTASPNGGGKDTYFLTLFNGDKGVQSSEVGKGTSVPFTTTKLYGDTTFKVTVTDKECSNSAVYSAISEIKKLTVENDLSFKIVSAHNELISDDFKNGKVAISTTLENVAKGEKITYTLKGGTATTKPVEVEYAGAMTISVDSSLFNETRNVVLTVVRKGTKVGDCESSASYTFTLNEGFSGTPLVITDKGVSSEIELCGGKEVTLEVTNAKQITFAEKSILTMTKPAWQWYDGDSPIPNDNEDGSKFTVKAESGRTHVYSVLFSAEDAGGMTRKIISNKFVVKGSSGVNVGRIYFNEYKEQTYVEHCVESDKTVEMSCDVKTKSGLQWYYSIDNGGEWKPVNNVLNNQQEPTSQNASIKLSVLSSMMKDDNGKFKNDKAYFRLGAEDTCSSSGAMTYSNNLLLVRFKTDVERPSVTVASDVVFKSETEIPETLTFSRFYRHTEPYFFVNREATDLGGSKQNVAFKDSVALRFGQNNVDILRSEKAQITGEVCMSDTLHYAFNIFRELKKPSLATADVMYCSNEEDPKYLSLNGISGGVPGDSTGSNYKTEWQYKTETGDWTLMQKDDNMSVFKAEIRPIQKDGEVYEQKVHVTNLTETINVRVLLSCGGGYPGGYVTSDEVKIKVYAPLKDDGIDFSTKEICFNTAIDTIRGTEASGGSGKYAYIWQKSTDAQKFEDLVNGEANNPSFVPWNVDGKYNLKETTYYRRIVRDSVCGALSISEVKTVFVRESFDILPEDVEYSKIVTSDSRASLYGVTDFSQSGTGDIQYVWWKSLTKEHARSAVGKEVLTEPLKVPDGDDRYTATYYVQALKGGCESSNKMPLDILVYNQNAGHIYVDGYKEDEKVITICSGDKNVVLLSSEHALNAEFEWYYLNGNTTNNSFVKSMVDGRVTTNITTPEVDLSTTNVASALTNTLGTEKKVKIFRVTKVPVDETHVTRLYGDTITLNIVPTLESVSNALFGTSTALAGEISISDGKKLYCLDDEPNEVLGELDPELSDYWDLYKSFMGPWLYNNQLSGGFKTYYEYQKNDGEWEKDVEYDYSNNEFAGMSPYTIKSGSTKIDGSYRVRRVMEDGCSSMTSNEVLLTLFDKKLNPDTVSTYAYTPDMTMFNPNNAIKIGYEVGDSIVFSSQDRNLDLVWYSDPQCTEVLVDGKTWCGIRFTEELANLKDGDGAYVYVKARRGDCYGEAVAVPFAFGSLSDGGLISIDDSIVCQNETYGDIMNIRKASGTYLAPKNVSMKWTYAWQYKRSSSEKANWSNIDEAMGEGLSADIINNLSSMAITDSSPLLFRRVATNDKGRVRYSNVLTLKHYSRLSPGVLSLSGEQNKFCTYDDLPYVKSTSPTGGKVYGSYGVTWQCSVDGEAWRDVRCFDSLYVGAISNELDRSENKEVRVRCIYADACELVESEPLSLTLYRKNDAPIIYQDNDSCDAKLVKLAVFKDAHEKQYEWSALYTDPQDTLRKEYQIWNYSGEDCLMARNGLPTSRYNVRSVDVETGCISEYYYFNLDSLPQLQQTTPIAPVRICAGDDLDIQGGVVSGGNGEKGYQWQISSTGEESTFSDIAEATVEHLHLEARFMKTTAYFRRIIFDVCAVDTSEAIRVEVNHPIPVTQNDILWDDMKCKNATFTVMLNGSWDSLAASEYWVLNDRDTLRSVGQRYQMEGFEGDSAVYGLVHYVTDTAGLTCHSDVAYVTAHNVPAIKSEENRIATDNLLPCNESYVKINGDVQSGRYGEWVKYKWWVNGVEQIGKINPDLSLRAKDTMRIVRVADNGCEKDTSNMVLLIGQVVFSYDYQKELSMTIVSNVSDSSVTLEIQGAKAFDDNYYFMGDGAMPEVQSNQIVLPYKYTVYKDSILDLYAHSTYCVTPYSITPLRGGLISFDGDTLLCGGSDIPSIVATDIEGGHGNYAYQWQYMNQFTGNFINIEGATAKEYVPKAVSVATTYRRVTTDGEYTSNSNAITISIRPLPKVRGIFVPQSDSALAVMGLKRTQYSVERLPSMELTLLDSISDVDAVIWQKSLDAVSWENLETQDANLSSVYSIPMADTTNVVYFRAVGISSCGTDTTKPFKVTTLYASFVTDEELVLVDSVCSGDPYVRISYKSDYSDIYEYSYRPIGFHGDQVLSVPSYHEMDPAYFDPSRYERRVINDTTKVAGGAVFTYPTKSFDVEITRYVKSTGASSTKMVHFFVDEISASFSYLVDDIESHVAGADCRTVRINQGSRVVFTPTVTSSVGQANYSYKWWLEDPSNVDYYTSYGGSEGRDGLTSTQESPVCYFYNPLNYAVKLQVSDGLCTSTVTDCGLYIDKGTFRSYQVDALFEEDEMEPISALQSWTAYPNPCTDWLYVDSDSDQPLYLFDMMGTLLFESIEGENKIDMRPYAPGLYLLQMDGQSVKVLKK